MMKNTFTPVALAVASAFVSLSAQADMVISEYVEGSSNNKAIELYNPTDSEIDLSQYQLAFYFNGSSSAGLTLTLSGTLAPEGVYVAAHSSAAADILATASLTNGSGWFNGDDAIVLSKQGVVVDSMGQVGMDPGSSWGEGTSSTQNNTLRRIDGAPARTDITSPYDPSAYFSGAGNDNFSDLGQYLGTNPPVEPEPEPDLSLTCADAATAIHSIQGNGAVSPLVGEQVVVEAVVSADFQNSNQLSGFFLSSLQGDNDPSTSEGVFVYHRGDDVNVGERVRLIGTVAEYYGATQLKDVTALVDCGTAAVSATPLTLPLADVNDLEAYEGMLVSVAQPLYVIDNYNLARYGEVGLASERLYQGTQVALPGAAANAVEADNLLRQLLLDDGSTRQNLEPIAYPAPGLDAYNTLRLGDTVSGLTGVLGYGFDRYRLHPSTTPQFVAANPRTDAPQLLAEGDIKVASFNVLNYFNGDGQQGGFPTARGADSLEEFIRQEQKLVSAITALDADIIGLMEIENDGFGEFSALSSLVNALNAASSEGEYAFVDFAVEQVGSDAITTALIYRKDKVEENGLAAINDQGAFAYGNRAAIAQTFKHLATDEVLTVAVAHLKSKGGCGSAQGLDADQNDGQACYNATRVAGANEFASWLASHPTGVNDEDIIIVGDMNAYAMEDPIQAFASASFANVLPTLNGDNLSYSYNFQGRLGSLDHALASPSLMAKVVAATDWHINADEPRVLDYNLEFKSQNLQTSLFADHPYRASDHDPVVVAIKAEPKPSEELSGEFTLSKGWFQPKNFTIELPMDFDYLNIELVGGWGDADLYVSKQRRGTNKHADCASRNSGPEELCQFTNPTAGKWKVRVQGNQPYGEVTLRYRATKY
ncbi:ExeM/NucH family extracellular endonuclease [Pseudoalteromonas sp. T1lg75]|uniref:ExeM/NucH family extracellular endonuclease n=1 Tax=Pseudoalteromonas sp. T1lg75 TaxID=2077102 RepID=UPI003FA34C36